MSKQILGVVALLASSVGSAATLNVTSSNYTPDSSVNEVFTVTLSAVDINNVGGITMLMTWDSTKASLQSASLPAFGDGPLAIGTGTFLIVTPGGANSPQTLDILPAAAASGNYNVAVLTFQALAAGPMNLQLSDDGGFLQGWFDFDTADVIPVQYSNADIQIGPAPVVPVPAAAWLLISALGSMVALKRRPL